MPAALQSDPKAGQVSVRISGELDEKRTLAWLRDLIERARAAEKKTDRAA